MIELLVYLVMFAVVASLCWDPLSVTIPPHPDAERELDEAEECLHL